jgi:hypothetical protein
MGPTAGWNIWTKSGEKIRQFTVACAPEDEAISTLKTAFPDAEVVSRHTMAQSTIKMLGIHQGQFMEWCPIDPKEKITRTGGQPIDKPMK